MTSIENDNKSLQKFFLNNDQSQFLHEGLLGTIIIWFSCCGWSSLQHSLLGKMIKH